MSLTIVQLLAIVGFALSVYYLYVKRKVDATPSYKAVCDINSTISCSKSMNSKYNKLFLVPNAVYGILFYPLIFILVYFGLSLYVFYLLIIAALFSLFLMFASFKIKVICPVYTGIYIVTFLMLYFSYVAI